MCLNSKQATDRMKDINHVKMLGKCQSNINNETMYLFLNGEHYSYCNNPNIGAILNKTIKVGEVWQWQQ